MGSHDLNQVLPWEQALRRLPGKGISDTVVRVEVFGLGNKYILLPGLVGNMARYCTSVYKYFPEP